MEEFKSVPAGSFIVAKPFKDVESMVGCYIKTMDDQNIIYVGRGGELIIKGEYRIANWDEVVSLVDYFREDQKEDKDMNAMGVSLLVMAIAITGSIVGILGYWIYQLLIN